MIANDKLWENNGFQIIIYQKREADRSKMSLKKNAFIAKEKIHR